MDTSLRPFNHKHKISLACEVSGTNLNHAYCTEIRIDAFSVFLPDMLLSLWSECIVSLSLLLPEKDLCDNQLFSSITETYRLVTYSLFFGSFGNEPMQSCSVRRVSLLLLASLVSSSSASVYSPPSDRFDHRSFISYKCMQLCP